MVRNQENNGHYSDQTGHKARSEASKTRRAFEQTFGVQYFAAEQQRLAITQKPPALSITEQQRIRRAMFRSPDSGRKKR